MDNVKVLIINYYYPPLVNGGVQRTYNFAKYLSQLGFDVSFLTTSSFGSLPDDSEKHVIRIPDKGYDYTHAENSSRIGVFLFRAFRLVQVKLGMIIDGKYYWKREVVKKIDHIFRANHFDVVIASYPTPANLEIGELIHKKYGTPLVIDYRDGLMYEPFFEIQNSFFVYKKRLLFLEKRLARIATLHITVNSPMDCYYSHNYPNVRSVIIPNGYDDEEVIDCEPLEIPEGINVLYTGSIGKSRQLYTIEELSAFLGFMFNVAPNIHFVFIGEYKEAEKNIFKKYKNVYVYNKTERKKIIATQKKADALLLISGPQGSTSGKLYEYLFSGKPILNIGGLKGIASIIDGRHFGVTCSPDDHEKIELFLHNLEQGQLKFEISELKQYTRRYQSEVLAEELRKIVSH